MMMHDSGLSDSKFMKCQKAFRKNYSSYNKFLKNIKKEKKKKGLWNSIKYFFIKLFK
jgi:hypothetical protein